MTDIEMLFQTLSLCSGSSSALSEMLEKNGGKSLVFPTVGAVEGLGSRVIGGEV